MISAIAANILFHVTKILFEVLSLKLALFVRLVTLSNIMCIFFKRMKFIDIYQDFESLKFKNKL